MLPGEPEKLVPLEQFRSKSQKVDAKKESAVIQRLAYDAWLATGEKKIETVADWSERWIEAKRAKGQTSWESCRSHLDARILPVIGRKRMRDVTAGDLEQIVQRLDAAVDDETLKWKSATNIWGTVTKMFSDATKGKVLELRARDREDNPAKGVEGPTRGKRTQKVHLFPAEFLQLSRCGLVPLRRRRAYALGIYLYLRPGELEAIITEDVDTVRGIVTVQRAMDREAGGDATKAPKAGVARFPVEAEPEILPLLRVLVREAGEDGRLVGQLGDPHHLAAILRGDLWISGVRRAELHTMTRTREWMTLHDLRTTGITWMAVRGDPALTMMARAGHHAVEQTKQYTDGAALVRRVYDQVFPPLPACLIEGDSAATAVDTETDTNRSAQENAGDGGGNAWESNPAKTELDVDSRSETESQRPESLRPATSDSANLRECPESRSTLAKLASTPLGRAAAAAVDAALTGDPNAIAHAMDVLAETAAAESLGEGDA
jgi:integrase